MKKEYVVEGMTCGGCVASVQKKLESVEGVRRAIVSLSPPLAEVDLDKSVSLKQLQEATGKYLLSEKAPLINLVSEEKQIEETPLPEKSIHTYKPLILIVSFILGVSVLAQYPWNDFNGMLLMRHFMAGFFIVFAFFKLLNISGFADSYSMYDIVAKRWKTWGFIYPFVELALGIAYLINIFPTAINIATIIILGISTIGVVESNLNKRAIKCACLGDVFNLPMSTVTIVEDVSMVLMAVVMLLI